MYNIWRYIRSKIRYWEWSHRKGTRPTKWSSPKLNKSTIFTSHGSCLSSHTHFVISSIRACHSNINKYYSFIQVAKSRSKNCMTTLHGVVGHTAAPGRATTWRRRHGHQPLPRRPSLRPPPPLSSLLWTHEGLLRSDSATYRHTKMLQTSVNVERRSENPKWTQILDITLKDPVALFSAQPHNSHQRSYWILSWRWFFSIA